MALAYAWVASFRGWRRIGFTSFPKVSRRPADRRMGLGTHYPPEALGDRAQVHDPVLPGSMPFWLQLPVPPRGDQTQELAGY